MADPKLVGQENTQTEAVLEGQLEEENYEEYNTATTRALPEEILEENQIIEPSLEIQEKKEISEDMISSIQYPQEEFTPLIPIKDLFPKIADSSFHKVDLLSPIDINQCSNLKVIPINQGLFHESSSYFLSYPKASNVSRTTRLYFVEVNRLHKSFEHVRFSTYFWKTLCHLFGINVKFLFACHPPTKGQAQSCS